MVRISERLPSNIPSAPQAAAAVIWVNTFYAIHGAERTIGRFGRDQVERRYLFSYSEIPIDCRNEAEIVKGDKTVNLAPVPLLQRIAKKLVPA